MNYKKIFFLIILIAVIFMSQNYLLKKFNYLAYPLRYSSLVHNAGELYGVDQEIIFSIMKAESGFYPYAKSHKDACGLMQISENTWNMASENLHLEEKIYDKESNIKAGTWYFAKLMKEFNNENMAIIAYNAGPTKVREWIKLGFVSNEDIKSWSIPYKETESYLYKVIGYKSKYLEIYHLDSEKK